MPLKKITPSAPGKSDDPTTENRSFLGDSDRIVPIGKPGLSGDGFRLSLVILAVMLLLGVVFGVVLPYLLN